MDQNTQRYGDIYRLGRPDSPGFVVLSNPQAIKELFTAPSEQFEVGRGNNGLQFMFGDNSLLFLDGEPHQQRRRLLMPAFHGEYLQTYAQQIVEIAEQVMNQWPVGNAFRVRPSMQEITLRVILRVVFGLDRGERYERLRTLLSSLLDTISSPLGSPFIFFSFLQKDWGALSPWGRFLRLKQQVKQLLYEEIQERRKQNCVGKDILSLLIFAQDEFGESMGDAEIHDELMTLLVAGHETTASALVWALYWIHSLLEVQSKLLQELEHFSDAENPIAITRLPYLGAIVAETLRIYPIAPGAFTRRCKASMRLLEYQFEAGTTFAVSIYSTHQREDLYPQHQQFRPERFLERQYSAYEYLPFGGSNRRCLGAALALMEMKLVLAAVVSRFQLTLIGQRPLKPIRRGVTLAPPEIRMRVEALKSKQQPISTPS